MSHYIGYETFDRNVDKQEVFAYIDRIVDYEHGDGYWSRMTWHKDTVYADYRDAEKAIERMDNGHYDDHAVLYYDRTGVKPTKAMDAITQRIKETSSKRREFVDNNHVWQRQSAYIGCPKCGSKLSREHLRTDNCPLCRAELRSATVMNRIKGYDEKIDELNEKYRELRKKQKGEVKWLVKYEFHC